MDKHIQNADNGSVRFNFGGLGAASASNYAQSSEKLEQQQMTTDVQTLQSRIIGLVGGGTAMFSAVRGMMYGRGWVTPGLLFFSGAYYVVEGFKQ